MNYFKLTGQTTHDHKCIKEAAKLIRKGEVVAFPTETVYGLGANAYDEGAINKIFQAKARPADNPLIVHVATKEQVSQLVTHMPTYVDSLIDAFSPGPLTYVMYDNGLCAKNVTGGLDTIAIRIPDNPTALALISESARPIAAPSANISGKPSPTIAEHVADDLSGKIAALIDGGETGIGVESTVLDCTGDIPLILRHGGVTKEEISKIIYVESMNDDRENKDLQPKSPGMKYKHYAPDVPLILVKGDRSKIQKVIEQKQSEQYRVALLATRDTIKDVKADISVSLGTNEKEVAQNLYHHLRTISEEDIDFIICESFEKRGVSHAIMDRLERAATIIV